MKILRYITVALMLLQAAVARAETITSGNFQYEIVEFMGYDEEEAVVVGLAEGFVPSGQLAFPSTVKYNGKNVKVVGIRIDPASAAPGIYIRRCGGKTEKRLIR